jgi:outer membrane murein-binding lipoprotein Lpp
MTIENKIDELTSLVKAMDTKMMFLQEDMDAIKEQIATINDTVINQAMNAASGNDASGKAQRLEQFRQQASRW